MPINGPDKWFEPRGGRFDGGGGGGDDGRMENRIHALETATAGMREDVAVIKATMATKDDVSKLRDDVHKAIVDLNRSMISWLVGLAALFSGIVAITKMFD